MSNHSPGPWYALAEGIADNAIGYRAIFDSDGDTVCNPSPMGEANARLIAAAPSMYAALVNLLEQIREDVPAMSVSKHFIDAMIDAENAVKAAKQEAV